MCEFVASRAEEILSCLEILRARKVELAKLIHGLPEGKVCFRADESICSPQMSGRLDRVCASKLACLESESRRVCAGADKG
ncbi:unnamed protein product [Protopolystoma xenopodis]|uniref:Uncharacterized protein n=1 Tax=Protopolystoma xenopodis TaxID=117903 RepID=A0A3S5ASR1_9PLAT|nr:unnamed protein product [Protopolystoma xenopodis]